MKDKKLLGVKMAEAIANVNSIDESNDVVELKQLLSKINEILDNKNIIKTITVNKEIRNNLKELIIKAVDILA